MDLEWSEEFEFVVEAIRREAPASSGVYEILQSTEYARYEGRTRILKIGKSESDLRQELLNHLSRHTAANRLVRIRKQGPRVSFKYAMLDPNDTTATEKQLLRDFEDKHWDLPLLNNQRGYERGEDQHYRKG